ncbi:MAG: phosphatase PAP2 family protein [Chitinophagales bacterium]
MSKLASRKYGEYIRDFTSLGNPFILLSIAFFLTGLNKAFAMIVLGFIINEIICSGIKYFFPKKRPNQQTYDSAAEKIDAGSFPSIHASRLSFVGLSLIALTSYFPHKILLLVLILVVGYSRIYLLKHYPIDVLAGYVFGALLFLLLFSPF